MVEIEILCLAGHGTFFAAILSGPDILRDVLAEGRLHHTDEWNNKVFLVYRTIELFGRAPSFTLPVTLRIGDRNVMFVFVAVSTSSRDNALRLR